MDKDGKLRLKSFFDGFPVQRNELLSIIHTGEKAVSANKDMELKVDDIPRN